MSGGHWDYRQYELTYTLENIARDTAIERRFPRLSRRLFALSRQLADVLHDLDWDLSGDSGIQNDATFERAALGKLRDDSQLAGVVVQALRNLLSCCRDRDLCPCCLAPLQKDAPEKEAHARNCHVLTARNVLRDF